MKNKQTITQYFGSFIAQNNQKRSFQNGMKRSYVNTKWYNKLILCCNNAISLTLRFDLNHSIFTYMVEACRTSFESIIIFSCNTIICRRLELLFSKRFFNSSIQFSNFPNNISSRFDEL